MRLISIFLLLNLPLLAGAETIPFDLDTGRPMVQLTVNGQGPYRFVFDTGAPGLFVASRLVAELGLEVTGSTSLNSPAGGTPIEVDQVRVDSISLGGAAAGTITASVLDIQGADLGMGVVGPALFRSHGPMAIDFENNVIHIGAAIPAKSPRISHRCDSS